MSDDDTMKSEDSAHFPTTRWSQLTAAKDKLSPEHKAALDYLTGRYWLPVYYYIRRRGHTSEQSEDLVQEFFTRCLEKELFSRADPSRGRFRSFLKKSVENFLKNTRTKEHAGKRHPKGGLVSIHVSADEERITFEPLDHETPEAIFDRAWAVGLARHVLELLRQECHDSGNDRHYELFSQYIVQPNLVGDESPPRQVLADKLGLTLKELSNRLTTARRAYQRLLRQEIRQYAGSDEEVGEEVRDIFRLISGK